MLSKMQERLRLESGAWMAPVISSSALYANLLQEGAVMPEKVESVVAVRWLSPFTV